MNAPDRPLLVWDGDCGFCRAWVARWRRVTGDRVDYAPFQEVAARFPEVPLEAFRRSVQLLEPDGRRSEGAEAVFRALARASGRGWPLSLYRRVPPLAAASEWLYRAVARNRRALSALTRLLYGGHVLPPGERVTAWAFLRVLGAISAVAFASLWTQVIGLAGRGGILPAESFLRAVSENAGAVRYWFLPTLGWLGAGDGALHAMCAAGTALSVLLALGFAPAFSLIGMWALYLSLATLCREFLWFQWDGLLLETVFLALFLAPWRWWSRPENAAPPSRAGIWLLRWLLFRLMFSSAAVKLASGDPAWRDLTALAFHYETQPLPPWTAWHMHQLPLWFQKLSAAGMFAIEGGAPFLIFGPRRVRFAAAAAIAALQVAILATGNYCFFNWLTLALCLLLLDDGAWPRKWTQRFEPGAAPGRRPAWRTWIVRPAAIALFALSLVPLLGALRLPSEWLEPLPAAYRLCAPWRTVNGYGLFAVMTTRRPEIVVEGSADGASWQAYEFRWKPGDPARRPAFVAPHQPRLDWQLWFAALGDYRRELWFLAFCQRLLEGSRPVRALLARDPFPDAPPRFVRATVFDYRLTDAPTRREAGAWWRREPRGLYCPVLTLENGRLVAVPDLP